MINVVTRRAVAVHRAAELSQRRAKLLKVPFHIQLETLLDRSGRVWTTIAPAKS